VCSKCDSLRQAIARTYDLAIGLTDPISIVLVKSDGEALQEKLADLVTEHQLTRKWGPPSVAARIGRCHSLPPSARAAGIRTAHERKPQKALPIGARGHGTTPRKTSGTV